jgi:hypothetical protein
MVPFLKRRGGARCVAGDEYDADRLFNVIQQVFAAASSAGIVPESGPAATDEAPAVPRDVRPDGDGNAPSQAAQKDTEVVRKDRARTTRVLIEARRTAESIVDEPSKVHALARIAGVLADTDPDRAAGLWRNIDGTASCSARPTVTLVSAPFPELPGS